MANYSIVGQYPDTEVIGGAKTRPVQVIEVVTDPHEVYFEVRVPRDQATTAYLKYTAQSYRDIYELVASKPGVADVQWGQRATNAGNLADWVTVYVESTSGDSSGVLEFPYSQLGVTLSDDKIEKLRAALDATEG